MGGAWSTHDEEECMQGLMGKTGGMRQIQTPRCKVGLIGFRVKTSGEKLVHTVRNLGVP
jgi:hypothetical protein